MNENSINFKHGHCVKGKESPTYGSWHAMKARCLNSNHDAFSRYGGRGIKICSRWLIFDNFLADMGVRPKGKTLDRIDNNGNYCKSNCRWATNKEQYANREVPLYTQDGKTLSVKEWTEYLGKPRGTIWSRYKKTGRFY